ncbi:hypothetical protein ACFSCZ_07605 [Siminovitchia sediminis]|uniref:DUF2802 domain-containing protein n=1 Tax=Siminovitchia sediminis TaxID=1274353 RepID=A0ABW4KEI3_9BACI
MEWTLGGLFAASIVLLVISGLRERRNQKKTQTEMDMMHITTMNEMKDVREELRRIELDMDIFKKASGIQLSGEEITFIREVLDLYHRKYSIVNIAEQKQASEEQIRRIISTYTETNQERRKVAP